MTDAVAPTNAEIGAEVDPVRRALLAAMQRLILGYPQQVPAGTRSLRDLSIEAGVGRHHLYQAHTDLADRFRYATREESGPNVTRARQLVEKAQAEAARLKLLQKRTRDEARRWKATAEVLQRAINVLQEELRQEQLKSARLARRTEPSPGVPGNPVVRLRPRGENDG